ncbi:MAG: TetR/AcrR family transcriptional regulator [Rhodospirillales bacterium]|nr:TetR/AcrR family transcriptional regulator [Rhodospirillales bacterium]MCW8952282.1 TetR/AcrR family transcriptional regulator [Rhodospirillales bacterium]MCW8971244.1 TetR/AcrR family transcriptional regulator [Rhodospirillales bacterium]MCW9001365.1 TetR/AcrR family transcriptional regulator [Rhodospirillales bacterium]MCW9039157.1 TetR/AcrR family transcriptional regulator [Rhodospirillales bacterium]
MPDTKAGKTNDLATATKKTAKKSPRKRLDRGEREKLIVEEAIRFFAEVGFEGQTRELAKRLGVTQPLLYRYFPSKEDLVERVYQEVFVRRWQPHWEELVVDTSIPLKERLTRFYCEYVDAIFTYEWVRIFMFAGLKGVNINRRYLTIIQDKLLIPLCTELRAMAGLPSPDDLPLTAREIEMAWLLHGGIYYIAIRKFVYSLPIPEDLDAIIAQEVETFLNGATSSMKAFYNNAKTPDKRK